MPAGYAGPSGHVGAARALLMLDRRSEALSRYVQAKALAGFSPDEELEGPASRRAPGPAASPGRCDEPQNVVSFLTRRRSACVSPASLEWTI